jgi:hypothetical protein
VINNCAKPYDLSCVATPCTFETNEKVVDYEGRRRWKDCMLEISTKMEYWEDLI